MSRIIDKNIPKSCEQCRSMFYVSEHQLKNSRGRFCSRTCASIFKSNYKRNPTWILKHIPSLYRGLNKINMNEYTTDEITELALILIRISNALISMMDKCKESNGT